MDEVTKTCTKCGEVKPLEGFYRDRRAKDGRITDCKVCKTAYRATPEARAYMKAFNARPEVRAAKKAYNATPEAKASQKAYSDTPKARANRRAYKRNKFKTDPQFVMVKRLRCRLTRALNGQAKPASTMSLVGCSPEKLCAWLEMHFAEGMTWENRSLWHIDHIRPIASFDDPADPACWNWSNLQPLWAADNIRKSDKC